MLHRGEPEPLLVGRWLQHRAYRCPGTQARCDHGPIGCRCRRRRDSPGQSATDGGGHPRDNGHVEEVEVVVAHDERATLRVGDVFLKIDTDQTRTDVEVEAMAMAPIPTPEVLWRKPPVLALAALPGAALGRLGEPSTASSAAWAAAGAAARMLHDAPLPPWPGRSLDELASDLDGECEWLVSNGVLPADLVTRNRRVAEAALRPWTPVFTHGDLQITHVFVDGDEITGVIDWSEASQGDALWDLATLTLGHEERLGDVVAGYGADVDLDVIRAWWSLRSLLAIRWLVEHGFDPNTPGCEFDVLRSSDRSYQAVSAMTISPLAIYQEVLDRAPAVEEHLRNARASRCCSEAGPNSPSWLVVPVANPSWRRSGCVCGGSGCMLTRPNPKRRISSRPVTTPSGLASSSRHPSRSSRLLA